MHHDSSSACLLLQRHFTHGPAAGAQAPIASIRALYQRIAHDSQLPARPATCASATSEPRPSRPAAGAGHGGPTQHTRRITANHESRVSNQTWQSRSGRASPCQPPPSWNSPLEPQCPHGRTSLAGRPNIPRHTRTHITRHSTSHITRVTARLTRQHHGVRSHGGRAAEPGARARVCGDGAHA